MNYLLGARTSRSFGLGIRPVKFSYFACTGKESKLLDCHYYTTSTCSYSYHAAVICQGILLLLLTS